MKQEIDAIILDIGNYASNEQLLRDANNTIIPYFLHYTDANLLLNYICELEEENYKLKSAMQDTYDSANDTCGELQQRIKELEEQCKAFENERKSLLLHIDKLEENRDKTLHYLEYEIPYLETPDRFYEDNHKMVAYDEHIIIDMLKGEE